MKEIIITESTITRYQSYLVREEKSPATIEKYTRDVRAFSLFLSGRAVSKELTVSYKRKLTEEGYAVRSINSMLVSITRLMVFLDRPDCIVKTIRTQRQTYSEEEKELTKEEYYRLLRAAKVSPRLCLLLQTICGTGIRVSELQYFNLEMVRRGEITISCKGKIRNILVPGGLKKKLLDYAKINGIQSGVIFRTRSGRPMNRSNIWKEMKKLCESARINPNKVFPHNLRKLFARTFYSIEKDIAKLADILGHSSIETTRIYIMTSSTEHRRKIECLGLVV
ncbi:site-specific integrase [Lacrimispora sp. NSJ-141]|uniref:Site-specific integrase n=1 Tax=Lientehia hominis TaxID=2897778 RepID=A0AAP2W7K5_9FIRM|nr:tyrosine-type recombinase/integrase [Lientehia hominis]MCD2491155.1 site-specific integrase [Lientehia hominis]